MRYNNSRNRNKKSSSTNFVKVLIALVVVALVGGGGYLAVTKLGNSKDEEKKTEVKQLSREEIEKNKLDEINAKTDEYPETLRLVANKRPETIDFVYDYPKKKDKTYSQPISMADKYTKGKIPLFSQWDDRWGYTQYGDDFMAATGCAPTSLAMAAVGLTGDTSINPKLVADYSEKNNFYQKGAGTKWNFVTGAAPHFGLKAQGMPINSNNIINTLKKGTIMMIVLKPGHFTTVGHFILLTGITDDNRVIVNDPFSKIRSNEKWDIDVFVKEGKAMWTLEKATTPVAKDAAPAKTTAPAATTTTKTN